MNSKLSRIKIKGFIKKNKINMDEYKEKEYTSFNDFFMREIKAEKRKIEDGLIAVCDSKLIVYKIDELIHNCLSFNILSQSQVDETV